MVLDDSCGPLLRKNDLYLYYHVCAVYALRDREEKKERPADLGVTNEPSILVVVERESSFFPPFKQMSKRQKGMPPYAICDGPHLPVVSGCPLASALTGTASI